MDLELRGRNAVVIGGSRGIGRSIALGLATEGANVAICARQDGPLRETESDLRAIGVNVFAEACDIANATDLAAFLDAARRNLGTVDILVHNASALAVGPDLGAWDASIQVDLMGAARACDRVIPWMEAAGGGSIVFISSVSGLEVDPTPNFGYTAAKAALVAYAKKLAVTYASKGIRVNAVAPGSTEFPGGVWAMVREHQPELYGMVRSSIPSGRLGTPEEIANVVVFLASRRASWVTGACVTVDGGQTRGMP